MLTDYYKYRSGRATYWKYSSAGSLLLLLKFLRPAQNVSLT